MFETLEAAPADAILGLIAEHKNDPRPEKIDLGVGVFRTAEGETYCYELRGVLSHGTEVMLVDQNPCVTLPGQLGVDVAVTSGNPSAGGFEIAYSLPAGDAKGALAVYDVAGRLVRTLRGHQGRVTSVVFAPRKPRLLTGGADRTARFHCAMVYLERPESYGLPPPIQSEPPAKSTSSARCARWRACAPTVRSFRSSSRSPR